MEFKKIESIGEVKFNNGVVIKLGDVIDGNYIVEIIDEVVKLSDGGEYVVLIENENNEVGWIVVDMEGNKKYNLVDEDYEIIMEFL